MFMCTKFGSYIATIDQAILQSLGFYFIVDTVYSPPETLISPPLRPGVRWLEKTLDLGGGIFLSSPI